MLRRSAGSAPSRIDAPPGVANLAPRRPVEPDDEPRDGRLAATGFADEPEGLAAGDGEAHPVDGLEQRARLRSSTRLSHGGDTSKWRATSMSSTSGGGGALMRCTSQHAARVAPAGISSGRSRRQRSKACGQRGWNAQPEGIAVRRGMVPSICARSSRSATMRRDRAHKPRVYGCCGTVDDVGDRTDLDDAPGIHHRDAIGGFGDHAHVVGDQHHRGAVVAAKALQQGDDLRLDRHVERSGRLVGDDELRVRRERQGDHDALAHAAGELVRVMVEAPLGRRNSDLDEQRERARAGRGGIESPDALQMVSTSCRPTV